MDHSLGLGRGARRVEDEQHVFGVHGLRLALGGLVGDELVVPVIAALGHLDVVTAPAHDDHMLDRGAPGQRLVAVGLEGHRRSPPPCTIGGDDSLGFGIDDAIGQGSRREAAEHDRVDGADAGTRQHRHRQLGDHAQVDGHPVAPAHSQGLEGVGEASYFVVELAEGDRAAIARLSDPVIGDLIASFIEVAVEAVVGEVELSVGEPLEERRLGLVQGLGRLLEPRKARLGLAEPETERVGSGALVDVGPGVGLSRELRRRGERTGFLKEVLDRLTHSRLLRGGLDRGILCVRRSSGFGRTLRRSPGR